MRRSSKGNTAYFINPENGNDNNSGLDTRRAWKSFKPLNQLILSEGDRVEITAPGAFDQTMFIMGQGTEKNPVLINFAPGRYDFYPDNIHREKYHISNTNDSPDSLKAVGILVKHSGNIQFSGKGAEILYRGKMMEVCIDSSENISISGLHFDYHRPTVSEFKVLEAGEDYAVMQVHKDSWYKIEGGKITWYGEGWNYSTRVLGQELNLETNDVRRLWDPLEGMLFEQIAPGVVRAEGKHKMRADHIYQLRETYRDYAAVFTRRSKNIKWENVNFHFLHGMGMVNQFSEDLTFDSVVIAPDSSGDRTTAAWADCLHISGCKGKVLVKDCIFKGAHDDAINIHGTYLQVVKKISGRELKLRFGHGQTYGFMAVNPGDEIEFINSESFQSYGTVRVENAVMLNPKEILITIEEKVPEKLKPGDVIENVTWTPEVVISGCSVSWIPTRGFLISTRCKAVVENNEFHSTHMSAILMAIDANNWFESGYVRDMTIRNNKFINCAEPVILIEPDNRISNKAVYHNILIEGNDFILRNSLIVKAKSTSSLHITGNNVYSEKALNDKQSIIAEDCLDLVTGNNNYRILSKQ